MSARTASTTAIVLALACLLASPLARAEKADRDKPVNIDADRMTVDDKNKVHIFEGNVTLTQGTLVIRSNKLVVTQDNDGFQRGVATGGPNGLAHIRQKREGLDEYTDGEGERIEHDNKLDQSELFNRAWVKSGKDEVRGEYIFIDGQTETYRATSGRNGTSAAATGGRVRAVIMPRKQDAKAATPAAGAKKPAAAPTEAR